MTGAGAATVAEICVVACAEAWRGDGAILASPMGLIPALGARLAQLTFEPDLLLTDGEAFLLAPTDGQPPGADRVSEGWLPFRGVFTMLAAGERHVMMGAAQLDQFGNQNISCIGDWARPKAQLLGVRGAPGNTVNHPVSYWIPAALAPGPGGPGRHGLRRRLRPGGGAVRARCRVPRAAPGGDEPGRARLRRPDHSMRLRSVHPGVSVSDVAEATGFLLAAPTRCRRPGCRRRPSWR